MINGEYMLLRNKLMISSIAACAILASSSAMAKPMKNGKFGVGVQLSFPTYGISVKKEMSDTLTAQATVGGGGFFTVIGGRGLYKFKKDLAYDVYGFGSLAYLSWSGLGSSLSSIGYGAGGGLEYDVAKDITINGEIGYYGSNFGNGFTGTYGGIGFGIGAHYWF
jgi:hypothetical protein